MNSNTINNTLKYTIIAGLFIIPFFPLEVANSLFFPFITGKAFVFRIVVEIILALWLILMIRDVNFRPKWSWMLGLVTLFALSTLVSDLLGVSPLRSIWSNFERMEGWITIIHLWAYFVVASSVLRDRKAWHNLFNITLFAGLMVACWGLLQLAGKAEIHQGSVRLDASLGNAAYFGVYMIIQTFLALYMGMVMWSKRQIAGTWSYVALSILFGFMVFETATRGSILGLGSGLSLGLIIFAIKADGQKLDERLGRKISIGILTLMIILGGLFYTFKDSKFVQEGPILARLASISLSDTKTQARGFVWPMAIEGFKEKPIFGWGQENFNYIFNAEYDPEMWRHEKWFDRAHSVYLDWLVAGGIVGFVLYLALYILSFVFIWKSQMNLAEKCTFTALVVGYAIHNVFVFDNMSSYAMFFMVLAFIHTLRGTDSMQKKIKEEVANYILIPVIIILFGVTMYHVNIRLIQVNRALIESLRSCSDISQADPRYFLKALSYDVTTANQEIREQAIQCSSKILNSSNASDQTRSYYLQLAQKVIDDEVTDSPNDARIYILAGQFFNGIGKWEIAQQYLIKAKELSPKKQDVYFELGRNYMNTGKKDEGLQLFKEAYDFAPDYLAARVNYGSGLILLNKYSQFDKLFGSDKEVLRDPRINNALVEVKNYGKVIQNMKNIILEEPTNIQAKISLSVAYYKLGDIYSAIQNLRKTQTEHPEYKTEIEDMIKQIQSGTLDL